MSEKSDIDQKTLKTLIRFSMSGCVPFRAHPDIEKSTVLKKPDIEGKNMEKDPGLDDWKSCKDCVSRHELVEEQVIHASAWDKIKRSMDARSLAPWLPLAKHSGNWVVIPHKYDACKFDDAPCLPDDVFHHCPWHGKTFEEKTPWWE
jgi:hypothetical protein